MQQPRDRQTTNEKIVASLVWDGHTNREIASRLHTSEQVVKNHLRSACDRLGVWSRLELAPYVASHSGADWKSTIGVISPAPATSAATGTGIGMEPGS
jgi:DNA-binding NarL/FixJ family response regulator